MREAESPVLPKLPSWLDLASKICLHGPCTSYEFSSLSVLVLVYNTMFPPAVKTIIQSIIQSRYCNYNKTSNGLEWTIN